jgi:hypothetical protein
MFTATAASPAPPATAVAPPPLPRPAEAPSPPAEQEWWKREGREEAEEPRRRRDDDERPRRRDRYDDDYEDDRVDIRRRRRDVMPHRGTTILVLGILSLVICGLLGPFAWVMGNNDLREIRSGRMDPEGEGATRAGQICGMIATILMIIGAVFFTFFFFVAIATAPRGFR